MLLPIMAGVAAAFLVCSLVACFMILKMNNSPLLSKMEDVDLPNFVGMQESDVKANTNFKYSVEYHYSGEYERGVVLSQNPKPPKTIKQGGDLKLKVSQCPQSNQMDDLVKRSRSEAERMLSEMDVHVSIKTVPDKKIDRGYVVKTDPEKGAIIHSGDTVILYVSSGDPDDRNKTYVVGVTGNSFSDATKILAKSNLVVGTYSYRTDGSPEGTVIEQHPAPGTEVIVGSTVSLVISSGPPKCGLCGGIDHLDDAHCTSCGEVKTEECSKKYCTLCKEHLDHEESQHCPVCGTVDCTTNHNESPEGENPGGGTDGGGTEGGVIEGGSPEGGSPEGGSPESGTEG